MEELNKLSDSQVYQLLVNKSKEFLLKEYKYNSFPTQNNLIENVNKIIRKTNKEYIQKIGNFARNISPLLHEDVLSLIRDFINFKKQTNSVESRVYSKYPDFNVNEKILDFVDRMIKCRPLVFYTSEDEYLLRDGVRGDKRKGFDTEKRVFNDPNELDFFDNYMTYDEIAIASMLNVSVPSFFINNGSRSNFGEAGKEGEYVNEGIISALVGARYELEYEMESLHSFILQSTSHYSQHRNDLLKIWAKFYNQKNNENDDKNNNNNNNNKEKVINFSVDENYSFPTYQTAEKEQDRSKYVELTFSNELYDSKIYFNIEVYKKRIKMTIDSFLLDANERAKEQGKKAYVHVIGIGLGVWMVYPNQQRWLLEEYIHSIQTLPLSHIGFVDFSWFDTHFIPREIGKFQQQFEEVKENKGSWRDLFSKPNSSSSSVYSIPTQFESVIDITFSKRNPSDNLPSKYKDYLLVASYAWDGNSYPGNEYWLSQLNASGDPAAACYSLIPELQNPSINPFLNSSNLKIATKTNGLISYSQYKELFDPSLPLSPSGNKF